MDVQPLAPLDDLRPDPRIAVLPKADLHVHQEWSPRLDRVLARRLGRPPYDWRAWAAQLIAETRPGMPRLQVLSSIFPALPEADAVDENFIARVEDLLEEAAADGAVLVELRFGGETVLRPGFMELFHEAERRVRERHPRFRAEPIYTLLLWYEPERLERVLQACLRAAREGLRGVDLLYEPYAAQAEWATAYRIAERAVAAGLGVTAHAGEFAAANIAAALGVPGLTRLGHAVYAAGDPRLLELLAKQAITVECCLSCNVVLGAVSSYEEHPIRQFVQYGIPVAFKRMRRFIAQLSVVPSQLANRLEQLFVLEPPSAIALLETLVGETVALVEQHMPQVDTSRVRARLGRRQQPWRLAETIGDKMTR